MAWPLSLAAQQAQATSHTMDAKCTVYSPTYGTLENLPISGGQVDADATSQVRRTATFTADPRFWDYAPGSLLSPFGSAVQIYYGIGLPSGTFEWVPQGFFMIDESSRDRPLDGDAGAPVKLVDLAARVAEDEFDAPTQTLDLATAVSEIIRLIRESLGPQIDLRDLLGSTWAAPILDMDRSRWADGVEKLADALSAEAFFDQIGRVVVRAQPKLTDAPVGSVRTGAGGNLLQRTDVQSRAGIYNRIIVSGERADGVDPVTGIATDLDPTSPTYYGGPFGKKPKRYTSPLATDQAQADAMATALLERARGVAGAITMHTIPHPEWEPGDVLDVDDAEAGRSLQIIDKLTTPLTPEDTQVIVTRGVFLPDEA